MKRSVEQRIETFKIIVRDLQDVLVRERKVIQKQRETVASLTRRVNELQTELAARASVTVAQAEMERLALFELTAAPRLAFLEKRIEILVKNIREKQQIVASLRGEPPPENDGELL